MTIKGLQTRTTVQIGDNGIGLSDSKLCTKIGPEMYTGYVNT